MKYRKKPVVIEAHRYDGQAYQTDDFFDLVHWIGDSARVRDGYLIITTLEGEHRADPGDWIIKGIKGEFYPCKPDIFAATYEPAE
jgi:hypothetical protein